MTLYYYCLFLVTPLNKLLSFAVKTAKGIIMFKSQEVPLASSAPIITESDFKLFQDFFYQKTGIWFEEAKRYFVDRRLEGRLQTTRTSSLRQYLASLRYDEGELQILTNLMTVNETYFYREVHQMDCLAKCGLDTVLADRTAKGRKDSIRIWSMPCSTGEEVYSLAIYLSEHWPALQHINLEIVGADINTEVLDLARQGVYYERSVRNLTPAVLRKYFKRTGEDQYQINSELRNAVRFEWCNLTESKSTARFHNFDIILCRNLLIYFDQTSQALAFNNLYKSLKEGGYIFLGHSESMSKAGNLFRIHKFPDNTIAYQKSSKKGA